ncbi:HNH endonuclease signature motif containing protein [uncultured Arthrobacter sp.]|uniref:HNH endonuclease n=1 Tax=uncultured Arthrobacter sp. TaxID=114050 RepID=UPI00344C7CFD
MSRSVGGSSRQWRELRARILKASDVCHICGRPGADAVDHIVPLARGGTNDPRNLAPAHHDVEPKCNRVKGDREFAPIVRRSGSLKRPDGVGG